MITGIIAASFERPTAILEAFCGRRPFTRRIDGTSAVNKIVNISVNDVFLSLLIRGNSIDLPILLVVHGGPGGTDIPFAKPYSALEENFLVVHYDQRGACKSYILNRNLPDFQAKLTLKNHVEDAIAVAKWLLENYGEKRKKIFLFGGSWGSM